MKRFHEEVAITERRVALARRYKFGFRDRGRYRKKDPFDCGKTRCGICHHNKILGHSETRQEKLSRMAFEEMTS